MEAIVSCPQRRGSRLHNALPSPRPGSVGSVTGSWQGSKEAFTRSQHVPESRWWDQGGESPALELAPEPGQPERVRTSSLPPARSFLIFLRPHCC